MENKPENNNEKLKPLSLENNENGEITGKDTVKRTKKVTPDTTNKESNPKPKPPYSKKNENDDEYGRGPVKITNQITLDTMSKDSINKNGTSEDIHYICLFGSAQSGKSVILTSLLHYFKTEVGVLLPLTSNPNSREAQILISRVLEDIRVGKLPSRTTVDQIAQLNFILQPDKKKFSSKKIKPIKISFLDTAGDNNYQIRKGGSFHRTLQTYIDARIPITFIVVTSYDNAYKEDIFISEFIDEIERRGENLKNISITIVVSKWDLSGNYTATTKEIEDFFKKYLPITNNIVETYSYIRTYYTVGEINKKNPLVLDNFHTHRAEALGNWLYKNIVGYPLDYKGTFWERIKSMIFPQ